MVKQATLEESHYSCLAELLENFADSIGKKKIHVTTSPKKTEAGNPDFRIWDGKQQIVGYVEAKPPTEENLDYIEDTDQLKRYRKTFPNLILTNFFEFRLYRNGQLSDRVLVARPYVVYKLRKTPPVERREAFLALLSRFFAFSLPKTYTAKSLAVELAKRTRFLKEQVILEHAREKEEKRADFVDGFYEAFREYLMRGLTKTDFADLYAQTITYGLFAARTRSQDSFNRKLAYDSIPRTIGILRDVFKFVSLEDLPQQLEWIVDDISEVLATTDVNQILRKFYHEGKGRDPVVHFYETFLAQYDPAKRKGRGVYYTPESVVSYIVRSLNTILKEQFSRQDGFADSSVTVLDPAAGTLTFLAEASKLAVEEFVSKYGTGGKEHLIKDHILKNFYAFELMMAPYTVGHLKMSFLLAELGYELKSDDRFKLYLTNTLEMEELGQTSFPGMSSLAQESRLAGKVKKKTPILVVLGNPPYKGISVNPSEKEAEIRRWHRYVTHYSIAKKDGGGFRLVPEMRQAKKDVRVKQKTWIGELIEYYKIVDGHWLRERNPKWLHDDYVKFIRFAQWKIDQLGEGILGFITNHSYLDNPTFRGMRQSLMNSFSDVYILDLHGNSLRKEKCPDGSKDENVFDIQQGVAIALFVKRQGRHKKCRVHHAEIWGLRERKYDWLSSNDIKTTKWRKLSPKSEFYLFIPRQEKLLETYEKYPRITEVFPLNSVGVVTSRDGFVIDPDREVLKRRIRMFCDEKMPDEIIRQTFNLRDKPKWKMNVARKTTRGHRSPENAITRILYRPFDTRWIFYHKAVIERPRKEVMGHMIRDNLGLVTVRQVAEGVFNHAFMADSIVESRVTWSNKGIAFAFPLYVYSDMAIKDIFSSSGQGERKPNLNIQVGRSLAKFYGKEPTSEKVLYYVYAILYANQYRDKYAEFLKMDFPRVPFTKDQKLFQKMGKLGRQLADLHLMKSADLSRPVAKFQGTGNKRMVKRRYSKDEGRVYINKTRYFEGVRQEIWEYQIGGYQVLDKWLKDRKGQILSLDDIKHYCKIVTALKKTIDIQQKIDGLYPDIEKEVIEFPRVEGR